MGDPVLIKPYGDTAGDGAVQVSFTLPLPAGAGARAAAGQLAARMGLSGVEVVAMESAGERFTFFVLYGHLEQAVEATAVAEAPARAMPMDEVNRFIRENLGRRAVVVGACIESDAHTVGIDAIMNLKGCHGHKGLEAFREIKAINLGAQVSCEDLLATAGRENADALLISQVVTQKNIHLANLTRLMDMLEAEGMRHRVVAVIGGPRISRELAQELGYDAGFGPGTVPDEVASFIAREIARRKTKDGDGGKDG